MSRSKLEGSGKAKNRPERIPLHSRKILDAEIRPGFRGRWVVEKAGAISMFQAAGWVLVYEDADRSENRVQDASQLGSVVRRVVNRGKDASSPTAVLMEIPEDLYNEDLEAKARHIDEIEASYDPTKFKQGSADYGSLSKSNFRR